MKKIALLTHFFLKSMSVSRDQPNKMQGEDSDQFSRFLYSSFYYSRHTCKCCRSICTLLRFNILYLYESFSMCGRPVYMEIVVI